MSDIIDAAAPTSTQPASARGGVPEVGEVLGATFTSRDLTRLVQGFYFTFWGTLAVLAATVESLVVPAIRTFHMAVLGAGLIGMVVGAARLQQARGLGNEWDKHARLLLWLAVAVAYLYPFFSMWRRLPTNLYLLGHAIVFVGGFIYWTSLLDSTIATLGRAVRRRSLVIQSVLFSGATFLLVVPFLLLAQSLIIRATQGYDPLAFVQWLLLNVHPVFVLALLVPFSLTLSLVWAAKDFALHLLTATATESTARS
jgi:hypothetical protein